MSIASELTRIINAKAALKRSIENKGVDVSDETTIDDYPQLVDQITGGPTPVSIQWLPNPQGYLRFKFITDGKVMWEQWLEGGMVEYSKDGGLTWTPFANESYHCGKVVSMNSGDEIWFRGNFVSSGPGSSDDSDVSKFTTTGKFYVSGNIQSLSNFSNTLHDYQFSSLFKDCKGLNIDAQTPLVLPATVLSVGCYHEMFYNCTSLTTAPQLPATTLGGYCYSYMFAACSSLTTAPELPATTLADGCYSSMFNNCSSLTTAPELPATTLAYGCYSSMFYGCYSLMTAPELPATTLSDSCYNSMFERCISLTSSPELPAPTLESYCYESMFENCISLNHIIAGFNTISIRETGNWVNRVASEGIYEKPYDTTYTNRGVNAIPERWIVGAYADWLPNQNNYLRIKAPQYIEYFRIVSHYPIQYCEQEGTGSDIGYEQWEDLPLENGIYQGTFDINKDDEIWFKGNFNHDERVESSGSGSGSGSGSPEEPAISFIGYSSPFFVSGNIQSLCNFENTIDVDYMFENLFSGNKPILTPSVPLILPATSLSTGCYSYMFEGCTSLTCAPALPATTLAEKCYGYMFYNCTSLMNAPALPATTLDVKCYQGMFNGCTSLTNAPVLPATTLSAYCYSNMFFNCDSLTTAPALPATTLDVKCYEEMFYGCINLEYVKASFVTEPSGNTTNWLKYVKSTGTFVKSSQAIWDNVDAGIPSGWSVITE